jgi:hypothetical protein
MTPEKKLEWIAFAALFPLSVILGTISCRMMMGGPRLPRLSKPQLLLKFKNPTTNS